MQKPFYKKPRFKLYQADCLELLNSLPKNMVSVKNGDWDLTNGTKKNFEFHNEWIKACRRVLTPNGTIWISGTYHSIYQCGFALEINKYHFLNDVAWFKPNASPNLSCRFFTASHETLLWARKEKKQNTLLIMI
ncbi:MAG: site-specific DNA-methyltransferase [Lutibacter sp.]|nr:site-specific DNA-methyltransferase [Lutibacter sp.]